MVWIISGRFNIFSNNSFDSLEFPSQEHFTQCFVLRVVYQWIAKHSLCTQACVFVDPFLASFYFSSLSGMFFFSGYNLILWDAKQNHSREKLTLKLLKKMTVFCNNHHTCNNLIHIFISHLYIPYVSTCSGLIAILWKMGQRGYDIISIHIP